MPTTPTALAPSSAPLAGLNANQYSTSSFTYPLNLNAPNTGLDHYVVFFVNQNNLTQFGTASVNGVAPPQLATINQNQVNDGGSASTVSQNISRVASAIALYMPNQVAAAYHADWNRQDLGAVESLFGKDSRSITDQFKDFGVSALQNGNKVLSDLDLNVAGAAGFAYRVAINNHPEVIFQGIEFREFNFEFLFVPQSEAEAANVWNIIQAFKFYWAPEVVQGTVGRFWLYPSEWDIQYFFGGSQNLWFNKISTCALTDIQISYTPTGTWSAHRSSGTATGVGGGTAGSMSPGVATRLNLTFKELEMMQKIRILEGY